MKVISVRQAFTLERFTSVKRGTGMLLTRTGASESLRAMQSNE